MPFCQIHKRVHKHLSVSCLLLFFSLLKYAFYAVDKLSKMTS